MALKTVGDIQNSAYYGFAVQKGTNPELIEMFNKGLSDIKENGKYDEILAKYGYASVEAEEEAPDEDEDAAVTEE